jgi:hypothetical protein
MDLSKLIADLQDQFNKKMCEPLDDKGDSLMCSLNQSLFGYNDENHNCLGCHLNYESNLIKNFLTHAGYIVESFEFFRLYLLQLYLYSEKILEVVKIVGLPEIYRKNNFFVFYEIKLWANFLKHPKAFILTHHPRYVSEIDPEIAEIKSNGKLKRLDFEFVRKYYSGDDKNKNENLIGELKNNKNVVLILPDLMRLTSEFCAASKAIVDLIHNNPIYKEILVDVSTLEKFYDDLENMYNLPSI